MEESRTAAVIRDADVEPVGMGVRGHVRWDEMDYQRARLHLNRRLLLKGPLVGDFVEFGDGGCLRRIAYVWGGGGSVQTTDGGSFHLGSSGYLSYSGSLFTGVAFDSLAATDEWRPGAVWDFHHGWAQVHSAVHFRIPLRVYRCTAPRPEY